MKSLNIIFTIVTSIILNLDLNSNAHAVSLKPESDHVIIRYDVLDVRQKHKLTPVVVPTETNSFNRAKVLNKLEVGVAPFSVTYSCTASRSVCNKARSSFEAALQKIAQAIGIKTQVNVQAKFYSFCNGHSLDNCEFANILGQAGAGAYYLARFENSSQYSYFPQALVKQYQTNINVESYAQYDIVAEFNTDYEFWHASDGVPIKANEIDMEYVVAHEVTHGLGFDSFLYSWNTYYKSDGMQFTPDIVGPTPVTSILNGIHIVNTSVNWDSVHVFDTYLLDNKTDQTLQCYMNRMYTHIEKPSVSLQSFYDKFKSSGGDSWDAALTITQSLTSGPKEVVFVPSDEGSNRPYISTFSGYKEGSSVAHLDYDTYWNTDNFLMVDSLGSNIGKSLTRCISLYGFSRNKTMYGPYGLTTLQILSSIGWPTVIKNATHSTLFIETDYGIDWKAIGTFIGPTADDINGTCLTGTYDPNRYFSDDPSLIGSASKPFGKLHQIMSLLFATACTIFVL